MLNLKELAEAIRADLSKYLPSVDHPVDSRKRLFAALVEMDAELISLCYIENASLHDLAAILSLHFGASDYFSARIVPLLSGRDVDGVVNIIEDRVRTHGVRFLFADDASEEVDPMQSVLGDLSNREGGTIALMKVAYMLYIAHVEGYVTKTENKEV